MNALRILTAIVSLTFLASLTSAQERPPQETEPAKAPTDDAKPIETPKLGTTVTLLEPGEEPRRELRYQRAGEAKIVLSMKSVSEQSVMGMRPPATRVPEIRFTMESAAAESDDGADIKLRLRFVDVEVVPDPNVPPPVLNVTQRTVGMMKGRSADLVANDRGIVQSMRVDGPASRPGALFMGDAVEAMREALRSALVVVPEEAVGSGARWRVETVREAGGVTLTERVEYRITAIEGETIRVAIESARTAKDQEIQMPGSPQRLTLRTYESRGTGSETISMARLMPVESKREEKAEMEIAMTGPGGTHVMEQTVQSSVNVAPAPESKDDDADSVDEDGR